MQEIGRTRVQRLKNPRAGTLTGHNISSSLDKNTKTEGWRGGSGGGGGSNWRVSVWEESDGVVGLKEGGEVNTKGLWKLKGSDRPGIKDCVYLSVWVCAHWKKEGWQEKERAYHYVYTATHWLHTAINAFWQRARKEGWKRKKVRGRGRERGGWEGLQSQKLLILALCRKTREQ